MAPERGLSSMSDVGTEDFAEGACRLVQECYEQVSIMLTSNLPFSKRETIFKDPMTTRLPLTIWRPTASSWN